LGIPNAPELAWPDVVLTNAAAAIRAPNSPGRWSASAINVIPPIE
jgi:hypothetical protein